MTTFLLKLTLCWGFFALLYSLLLRQETFFRANRIYLLGTAALGILLAAWPAEQLPVPVDDVGMPVMVMPEFTVGIQQMETATSSWQDMDLLWMAYWLGFAWMMARVLWGLIKIVQMAIRGQSERLPDNCLLIQTAEAKVPFSFFRWVFVPVGSTDFSPSGVAPFTVQIGLSRAVNASVTDGLKSIPPAELMLAHERAHAHSWHSADVLFAELLCVLFWFHPLAHWYRKALRTVHEYQADAVASRLADRKQYGLLLIGQSQSGMPIAFANHFFQSPLKQRLIMLTKKASTPLRAVKFGLVAPIALLFAMLFRQATAIAQVVDEKHLEFVRQLEAKNWMVQDTVITFNPDTYEETMQLVNNSAAPEADESGKLVYRYAEIQPQFPGGQEAMVQYLTKNLRYPESEKKGMKQGTLGVSFVVDEEGNVLHPKVQNYDEPSRPFVIEAERVVQAMPKWTPARHKGKVVRCSVNLPIQFSLASSAPKPVAFDPEFLGGAAAMSNYLAAHLQYPETAKKAGAEGTAVIKFVVKEDGSLTDVGPGLNEKPLHPDLMAEAIRVVKTMPKWRPGLKDGKLVATELCIPIKFKLDQGNPKELFDVDVQPEFPGGLQELYNFLGKEVKYPEAAKKAGAEGLEVITFIVEADGSLSNFDAVKVARQDCSDEVIRALKLSPNWKPASKNGKAVRVKYTLPFKFKLGK